MSRLNGFSPLERAASRSGSASLAARTEYCLCLIKPITNHQSLLTSHGRDSGLTRMVLLRRFKPNLLPYRLDLPPLPLSPADEIPNEKPLQSRNQRHGQDKENARDYREIEKQFEHWIDPAKRPF
jgi:hypothetical protein